MTRSKQEAVTDYGLSLFKTLSILISMKVLVKSSFFLVRERKGLRFKIRAVVGM